MPEPTPAVDIEALAGIAQATRWRAGDWREVAEAVAVARDQDWQTALQARRRKDRPMPDTDTTTPTLMSKHGLYELHQIHSPKFYYPEDTSCGMCTPFPCSLGEVLNHVRALQEYLAVCRDFLERYRRGEAPRRVNVDDIILRLRQLEQLHEALTWKIGPDARLPNGEEGATDA